MENNNVTAAKTATKNAVMDRLTKSGNFAGFKSQEVGEVLTAYRAQIAQALPRHLTADRIIAIASTVIARNQKLAKCTASSLIGAVVQASILGFPPVEQLGFCYFVPFDVNVGTRDAPKWEKQVQFIIGYKGFLDLTRRSGQVKMIYAEVVRQGDEFSYRLGLTPELNHLPKVDNTDAPVTHAYAVCHFMNGGFCFVVLTRQQIEALRLRNASQKKGISGAWLTDYSAMAQAKAIRQLSKYMPLSIELQTAIATDEKVLLAEALSNDGTGVNLELTQPGFEEAEVETNGTNVENPSGNE